ncbi:MAG: tRNA (adenine(22)-N(1))-methyltransferase [Bacilli bacterium]
MSLSLRLQVVASLVPIGIPAADIGADHGLLITHLIKNKIIPIGYASDNKKGPYENLIKKIKEDKLENEIKTDLCSGLHCCPSETYKTIIICGMGGELIKNILQNDEEKTLKAEYLLLGPQGGEYELRSYLLTKGFYPEQEKIVYDDHFYEILLFSKRKKEVDELDKKYGYYLRREKNSIFIKKYLTLIDLNDKILLNPHLSKEKRNCLIEQNKEYQNLIKEC